MVLWWFGGGSVVFGCNCPLSGAKSHYKSKETGQNSAFYAVIVRYPVQSRTTKAKKQGVFRWCKVALRIKVSTRARQF